MVSAVPSPHFKQVFFGGCTPATHRMHAGTPSLFSHTGYCTFELSCVWRCVIPPQPAKWHNSSVDGRAPNRFEVACSPSGCVESFPLPVAVMQPPLTPPTFSDRRSICNRMSDCCSAARCLPFGEPWSHVLCSARSLRTNARLLNGCNLPICSQSMTMSFNDARPRRQQKQGTFVRSTILFLLPHCCAQLKVIHSRLLQQINLPKPELKLLLQFRSAGPQQSSDSLQPEATKVQ